MWLVGTPTSLSPVCHLEFLSSQPCGSCSLPSSWSLAHVSVVWYLATLGLCSPSCYPSSQIADLNSPELWSLSPQFGDTAILWAPPFFPYYVKCIQTKSQSSHEVYLLNLSSCHPETPIPVSTNSYFKYLVTLYNCLIFLLLFIMCCFLHTSWLIWIHQAR